MAFTNTNKIAIIENQINNLLDNEQNDDQIQPSIFDPRIHTRHVSQTHIQFYKIFLKSSSYENY